jgi:hypothetical protein
LVKTDVHNFEIERNIMTHNHFPKGLDGRQRDQDGEIRQKRGDTLNKNLPNPISQFSPNAKLATKRNETGMTSEKDVRAAAKKLRP